MKRSEELVNQSNDKSLNHLSGRFNLHCSIHKSNCNLLACKNELKVKVVSFVPFVSLFLFQPQFLSEEIQTEGGKSKENALRFLKVLVR